MRVASKLEELFGADLRSLAIFRISLGLLLLTDLIQRATDLTAHYTDAGVLPRAALLGSPGTDRWHVSLHLISGTWPVQAALFLLAGSFAGLLLVGYRTRRATFVSWALLISLHSRNPLVLYGGDVLLRLLLFWGLFVPLGARYSLDSLLNTSSDRLPKRVVSMGTAALLAQVVVLYGFTAALKSGVEWRQDASAVYYALSLDQFATPLGTWLLGFPRLVTLLTPAVWWFEALGPCLLFSPVFTGVVRTAIVLGFLAMQASFGLCMTLGLFPWIGSAAMLPFVPTWLWDACLMRGWRSRLATSLSERLIGPYVPVLRTRLAVRPLLLRSSTPANALAACFLVYVVLWNLGTLRLSGIRSAWRLPTSTTWVGNLLRIDQRWPLFAPYPLKEDGWYVIPGTLKDGTRVDLFTGGEPVRWEKPTQVSAAYRNFRWNKFLTNLRVEHYRRHCSDYAGYLCRQWNARHREQQQLDSLRIVFMREDTLPDYQTAKPKPEVLWRHRCQER